MKQLIFILFIAFVSSHLLANDTIIIRKDPRFDVLASKQAAINKRGSLLTSAGFYKGYRIQLISSTNRDQANNIKTDALKRFPDEKAYLLYNSPYFKVRMGNFIKKEDAEKFRQKLNKFYPSGVYVVDDAIEYTPKDDEEISAQ